MIFKEIVIKTTELGHEMVAGVLIEQGITTFAIEDRRDLDTIMNNKSVPYDYVEEGLLNEEYGKVSIKVYLADNYQGAQELEMLLGSLQVLESEYKDLLGFLDIDISSVDDEDWKDNWREFFRPLPVGERFLIKPSWEQAEPTDRIILEIDPESSFGTGQHETTALCLEVLETMEVKDNKVLDMGCGSGILGIGAALLGAGRVIGVDVDQNATEIAKKNSKANGINQGFFSVRQGNVLENKNLYRELTEQPFDIILANIAADILVEMAGFFAKALVSDGVLIASGIIESKTDKVTRGLAVFGFDIEYIGYKNDWVVVKCRKKKDST